MIRPFTLITMLLAAGSGAYLFGVKHRAQSLDNQLSAVNQAAQLDAQRITVLQAQWALETDPTRLSALARQFSKLQPMKPAQLVTLAALRMVLPPAVSLPAGSLTAASPAVEPPQLASSQSFSAAASSPALVNLAAAPAAVKPPVIAAANAAPAPETMASPAIEPVAQAGSIAPALPLPPPLAPGRAGEAKAAAPRVVRVAARPVGHSVLHVAQTRMAENLPPPRPLYAPRPALPAANQFAAARPVSTISAMPVAEETGSVLGMAADLAPPRPLPPGIGN
jgi:hypothetical protein